MAFHEQIPFLEQITFHEQIPFHEQISFHEQIPFREQILSVKYKRDFEESKGRGFSFVTDTPELQRLKRTQEQISNVGDLLFSDVIAPTRVSG
ncbi:hypothetical protein HPG69_012442 [Diceros bicornis minor]|uniref:Uncharacterized protein n=1 Tax=Diceros bicornis minor TaxID=77932 RepID=A0A7J7FLD5_DICBM|nr:hypothetical protein HPG69_012442 [Diceros bicornis minor]